MSNGKPGGIVSRVTGALIGVPEQPSKIGWNKAPDRTIADQPGPQADQGRAEARSFFSTYFTRTIGTQVLYNGDRQWARVTLTLETAGPVVVGNQQSLTPVTSGKGQLLTTSLPVTFTIAKGTRLYIASTSVNRVKVAIEPVPWLEQITGLLGKILGR